MACDGADHPTDPTWQVLQDLASLAPEAVVLLTPDQRLRYLNGPARTLLAATDATPGAHCLSLIRSRPCMSGCPLVEGKIPQLVDLHLDGSTALAVQRSGGPVRGSDGRVVALVEVLRPRQQTVSRETVALGGFVTRDPVLSERISAARRLAGSHAPLLVVGPTGAGRSRLAAELHRVSPRVEGPLVRVHAAEVGLRWERVWPQARGGTVLIDDIELMARAGEGLLAAWPGREADVRIIATARPELDQLVREGRFLEPLYYRLRALRVDIPPLDERPADIPLLAERLLAYEARRLGTDAGRLAPDALERLERHHWRGNVRELQAALAQAVATSGGELVRARDLPGDIGRAATKPSAPPPQGGEAEQIRWALEQTGGRIGEAAELLGVSRATFWRRRRALGI